MNRVRYRDRDILCKYDLSEEFFNKLGVKVKDIIPLRKVFIIVTDEGKKILKRVDESNDRLEFLYKVTTEIKRNFKNILTYNVIDNKAYIEWLGEKYILMDLVEGREVTYTNPLEIKYCAEALAKFHKASKMILKNISSEEETIYKGEYLPMKFMKDIDVLYQLKQRVGGYKYLNKFDTLFMDNIEYYIKDLKKALKILALCDYKEIIQNKKMNVLCHNDLAHHNFIINNDEVSIIDFDYCSFDIRTIDIANFILKVIKNQDFDKEKVKIIINSYDSIERLDNKEIKLIYSILSYPRDFVTIVKDYYFKQKSWDEDVFISRFKEKIDNEVSRRDFLDNFIDEFEEYFY